ncbi:hypothetical protein BJX64DRAFT_281699 [Aspergillus heterothallicus]
MNKGNRSLTVFTADPSLHISHIAPSSSELQHEGDLLNIKEEVNPAMQLVAITRKVNETEEKAALFQNIKGRQGDGLFSVRRACVGLNRVSNQRLGRIATSIGLQSMHCTGKFLETYGMHIVQTPDRSWKKQSVTRNMVHGKPSTIYQKWADKSEDSMEIVMISGMRIPTGVDEAGFIGALIGAPVDVAKCEKTNGIREPANAEITVEETMVLTVAGPEGLVMEHHGHVWPRQARQCPVFKVNAITATEENLTVWALIIAAEVLAIRQMAGLPDIDPTNLRDVIWAESTSCEPGKSKVLFEDDGAILLVPYIRRGASPGAGRYQKEVVKCCMFATEYKDMELPWNVGSFQSSCPLDVQ